MSSPGKLTRLNIGAMQSHATPTSFDDNDDGGILDLISACIHGAKEDICEGDGRDFASNIGEIDTFLPLHSARSLLTLSPIQLRCGQQVLSNRVNDLVQG